MTPFSSYLSRIRILWARDPKGMSIDLLRVGIGVVWAMNLAFIVAPSNQYFPMFGSMASSFGPTTLGGPGFANFVASYPVFFAWAIAVLTGYLAIAFLAGFTTRFACTLGALASVAFLLTQYYSTFAMNGSGTDVGAHPLYLLIYAILFTGGAGQYFAFDHWVWASGHARFPRLSRWTASPRDIPCNASCPASGRAATQPPPAPSAVITSGTAPRERPYPSMPTRGITIAVTLVVLLGLGTAGILALHASPASGGSSDVYLEDIQFAIHYPGNASTGGFGPDVQNGCWDCAQHMPIGASTVFMEMLTDDESQKPLTVVSLHANAPFALSNGPHLPQTVPSGKMWMFDVTLTSPMGPGSYSATLEFTVV